MKQLITFPLLLASASSVHAADLYKWFDAEEHVYYTDQPANERKIGRAQ